MERNKPIKYFDLTIPQENIWVTEQLNPNMDINHIYGTLFIDQKMDLELLKVALNRMIENNDALRIRVTEQDTKPMQSISDYEYDEIPVYFVDDDKSDKIQEIIHAIGLEHMPVLDHKLYDFRIIACPDCVYLCVKMHHIIADAWSMAQLFVEHFGLFYEQAQNNVISEKKPSYLHYIEKNETYKNSEKYEKDKKFWEKYVKNLDCRNEFEVSKNKKSNRIEKSIEPALYHKISDFCKEYNITEYSFFLGILSTYFSKLFSNKNLVIGTPFLNRKKADKELDMMGMFVATLPLYIDVSPDLTFVDLCKQITRTNMACFKHSGFPYREIQKEYENFSGDNTNLYEIVFSYQMNNLEEDFDNQIYKNTWYANSTQVNPLFISYMNHFGEHLLCYDYRIDLFNEQDITLLHERLIALIKQVFKNNTSLLQDFTILSETDIDLLKEFNSTGDFVLTEDTIVSRFKKIVNKNKSKVALKYHDIEITYNELNKKANSVANSILQRKIKKGSAISIIFDKSPEMLISMLGIMKAGCYYIPILPEEEQNRAEYIIQNSESQFLITDKKYATQISKNIIENQAIIDDLLNNEISEPEISIKPNNLCYLIYTSGTTGTPKGVMIKHENVISLITSVNADENLKFLPDDIAISLLKYSFDASAIDIYTSLLNGGKLILIPKEIELDSEKVVAILEKEKITRTFAVSKWLEQIQNILIAKNSIDLSNFRIFGTGGEVLKLENFKPIFNKCPNLGIYNAYGPTETTMFVTDHKINEDDFLTNHTPIGKLIPGARALVMKKNSTELLPINTKGELIIFEDDTSLKNIANGYFNLNDTTNKKFIKFRNSITKKMVKGYRTGDLVKINNDLKLEFLGREDDFVKISGGYLVSLNEIENRIQSILGNTIEVCVVSIPIRDTNSIILYIVKNDNSTNIKLEDIKNEIDHQITFYMKPKKIIEIDKLPLTKNGKINRKLLEQEAILSLNEQRELIKPTNKTEQIIYDILKEIIPFDFSITDDFEDDLGIDSLNMTILYSKLSSYKLTLQDLYTYPTVKDLAYMIKKECSDETDISNDDIKICNASNQMDLEKILLTGATGFVGVNLLKEFAIHDTTKKIYCIIRQKLNLNSEERFQKIIHTYFDEETCQKINKKTIILNGDLRKEKLGFNDTIYHKVFKEVKTIIHAAANVKHIGKYHTSYVDNVETVKHLIEICTKFHISLAHISTLSVNGYKNEKVKEKFTENTLNIKQTFNKNPYLISKYEAEKSILKSISEENLNAKIFRIGNIMPRISDGIFQINFDQNGFLLVINTLQKMQSISEEMLDQKLHLTPVDECCKCIFEILTNDFCNTIYHIESDKKIKLSTIIDIFEERNIPFKIVTQKVFDKQLSTIYSVGAEHLFTVLNQPENKYSNAITQELCEQLGFEWQSIKKEYLQNIINIAMKIK